jgi:hypothetical protein
VPRGCTIGPEQRKSFVISSRSHFGAEPASLDDPHHPIRTFVCRGALCAKVRLTSSLHIDGSPLWTRFCSDSYLRPGEFEALSKKPQSET